MTGRGDVAAVGGSVAEPASAAGRAKGTGDAR